MSDVDALSGTKEAAKGQTQDPLPSLPNASTTPNTEIEAQIARAHGPSLFNQLGESIARTLRIFGYKSLIYSWRLRGNFPLKLIKSPEDPWPGNTKKGQEFLSGQFHWGGYEATAKTPPFHDLKAPEDFRAHLHSFRWLRDLAETGAGRDISVFAEASLRDWLDHYTQFDALAWRADVIGERIIFLTSYAPLILGTHDLVYRSKVLNGLARHARHLHRTAARAMKGLPRVKAATGLIYSGLLLPGSKARRLRGEAILTRELSQFIFADGGVETRSPQDMLDVAMLMISLRATYRSLEEEVADAVQTSIDRLIPALKAVIHGDGNLAAFHGSKPGCAQLIKQTIKLSESNGKAMDNGALSGFQRLSCGKSLIILDAGPPPAAPYSRCAHASILAFEFSHKKHRIFVNCGSATGDSRSSTGIAEIARTTAAHTALVIGNTNSAQLRKDGTIGRAAEWVHYKRNEGDQGVWLDLEHDGYQRRFGLKHRRRIFLSDDGLDLRGEDSLEPFEERFNAPQLTGRNVDIRFHLHPDVEATPTQDGAAAILRLPDKSGWMFRARGADLNIDHSLYVDGDGLMHRTRQIVLILPLSDFPLSINWSVKAIAH